VHQWIVDPLDGTTNFLHGVPHYAVSIACLIDGRAELGLIYDPTRNEMFRASRGRGAYLERTRMRVSGCRMLSKALVGSGFLLAEVGGELKSYLATVEQVMVGSRSFRRSGSAALDLAYVAAGRLDAFWQPGLKIWDLAAGALLVQEAGGMVSDFSGQQDYMRTGRIIAATPGCHQALKEIVDAHGVSS